MKKAELVKTISLIDEVYKSRGRQNFIGISMTGIGLTIAALGITVLVNKPEHAVPEQEEPIE